MPHFPEIFPQALSGLCSSPLDFTPLIMFTVNIHIILIIYEATGVIVEFTAEKRTS